MTRGRWCQIWHMHGKSAWAAYFFKVPLSSSPLPRKNGSRTRQAIRVRSVTGIGKANVVIPYGKTNRYALELTDISTICIAYAIRSRWHLAHGCCALWSWILLRSRNTGVHSWYVVQFICSLLPLLNKLLGGTHLGPPLQIIDIGETFLPEEVVIEYIESQRSVFTYVNWRYFRLAVYATHNRTSAEKYHLLDFNCNTFSNDLCQFLTGTSIPKHITDLPSDFLNTYVLSHIYVDHIISNNRYQPIWTISTPNDRKYVW